jgi:N-hydroxyarylamine O-acetyltransferase
MYAANNCVMHRLVLIGMCAFVSLRTTKEDFVSKYLRRLKLDPSLFQKDGEAFIEKLRAIHEAHLAHIPFENLSQHGCTDPATVPDLHRTKDKILNKRRGGFCFELDGLFAKLLIQLGYTVGRVPAHDCVDTCTHIILIVACSHSSDTWFVDVGFGEPPLRPLKYGHSTWYQVQVTPEGMKWLPNLKWNYKASLLLGEKSLKLAGFAPGLAATQDKASIFSQKLICCRLTREKKYTVAGHRFKTTGSTRFPQSIPGQDALVDPPVHVHSIASLEELRAILRDHFDVPLEATEGVGLQSSLAADPMILSQI